MVAGPVSVCLSGGSTPQRLYQTLAASALSRPDAVAAHALVLGRRALRAVDRCAQQLPHGPRRDAGPDRGAGGERASHPDRRRDAGCGRRRLRARAQGSFTARSELEPGAAAVRHDPARPGRGRTHRLALSGHAGPQGKVALGGRGRRRQARGADHADLPALESSRDVAFLVSRAQPSAKYWRGYETGSADVPAARIGQSAGCTGSLDRAALVARRPVHDAPSVLVVMGVSGSGKTTVAALLAGRLHWEFEDADDLHPAANVAKMHAGIPLTDADRWPWLHAVASWIDASRAAGRHGVVACSALKRSYRDIIVGSRPDVRLVYLKGDSAIDQRPAGVPARPFHAGGSAGKPVRGARRADRRRTPDRRFDRPAARKRSRMSSCRSSSRRSACMTANPSRTSPGAGTAA